LNGHDPARVVALYAPTAAHITSSSTKTGHAEIRAWYQSFFNMVLPNAKFTLSGYSGSGNSRNFTWTATSEKGEVHNGNDVFGLLDGRIVYHYTFFSVIPAA
jgi:ketosteroid isomerase-like protein